MTVPILSLSETTAQRLWTRIRKGTERDWEDAMGTAVDLLRDTCKGETGLQDALRGLIASPTKYRKSKMADHLPNGRDLTVHPFAAHVFRHYGTDALPLAMICELVMDRVTLTGTDGIEIDMWYESDTSACNVMIYFADEIGWTHRDGEHQIEIGSVMPDTVANALMGRPLSELLGHDALQGMTVVMDAYERDGPLPTMVIKLASPKFERRRK